MEHAANQITLRGSLHSAPQFSHENHGRRFFRFSLEVPRLSGAVDILPVIAEETRFEMGTNDDWFTLYISPEDLRTLGVKYICLQPLAERAPEAFYDAARLIYADEMTEIYRLDGPTPTEE